MRTSSAKSKGRRACAELRDALLGRAPSLQPDDIVVTSSGVTGEDLMLSPAARMIYPFCFEVKNQESLSIWAALAQAAEHVKGRTLAPILAFRRNRSEMYVAMKLTDFVRLIGEKDAAQ